jgi:hypothetical protein
MPKEIPTSDSILIPPQPIPAGAEAFARQVHELLDGQPKDEETVEKAFEGMDGMFDLIAAGLYSIASMLVGAGEDSIVLVEAAVANAEVSAVEMIANRDPESLAAPVGLEPAVTCIEDDDLDAASEAREDLERMIEGPDRDRVRNWLESLPTALRTIYVLRAVAGLTAVETADLLASHGGPLAPEWDADAVRELFRQALCSLASQLIHASAGK